MSRREVIGTVACGVAALALAATASGAPVVTNGSFEEEPFPISGGWDEGTGPVVGWTHSTSPHGSGVYGWTPTVGPNLNPAVRVGNIPDGTHAAYMWNAWGTSSWFEQTVSGFEVGKEYVLTYRENFRTDNHQASTTNLRVTLDGTTLVPVHQITYNDTEWYTVTSDPFEATKTSYTLRFNCLTPGYSGDAGAAVLDAVAFREVKEEQEIPEPASAMLVLAGAGVLARRRRKV